MTMSDRCDGDAGLQGVLSPLCTTPAADLLITAIGVLLLPCATYMEEASLRPDCIMLQGCGLVRFY